LKKYALIVAGGSGKRLQTEIPKQFIYICGKPFILHTIDAFIRADSHIEFIVVINEKFFDYWEKICRKITYASNYKTAIGGPERFHSVKNGLAKIPDSESLVAIHDAVRPFISEKIITKAYKEAEIHGNAIPYVKINDTVRIKNGTFNETFNREQLAIIQTPQCFKTSLIKEAYRQNYDERFTDDAIVLETTGQQIRLIDGDVRNIKITHASDLIIAEAFLKSQQNL
jgi:2-C-methyl-D-erythritol 4-phosphate cytidylyltransferase